MTNDFVRQAEHLMRRLGQSLARAIQRAERQSASTGVRIAKDLSSGKKSSTQLRREGHPFARRHGRPQDPPEVINAQQGKFREGWHAVAKAVNGESVPVIGNETDVSKFLKSGTRKMFARPIDKSVGKLLEPVRLENLEKEVRKLEK